MSSILKERKSLFIIIGIIIIAFIISIPFLFNSKFEVKAFEETVEISYEGIYEEKPGNVCYGNIIRCSKVKYSIDGEVDTNKIGDYEITYTYKYNGKTKKLKQKISVVDKDAPKLEINSDKLSVCPNGKISNLKITAIDNVDGDISDKVKTEVTNNSIIITIEDNSGNENKEEINITKEDKIAPTIKLNGDEKITLGVGSTYNDLGANATDNCDEKVKIEVENKVDTKKAGTYKVTYTATDSSNNKSTKERTIIVKEKATNYYVPAKGNKNTVVNGKKIIYLTFDDGPSDYTGKLLDILKKYNVKATFFVTGFGSDSAIKREYDEGHTVALHSNTHNYSYIYKSLDNYYNDLYKIRDRVKRITGHESNIIRFPGGSSNTVSRRYDGGIHIMSKLVKDVESKGFHYFDWNVSSGDAGATTSSDKVYSNVVNHLKSDVSVVLQHDSKSYSVNAVERIIKYGLDNGFTFKALDENSFGAHHGVNN